MARRRRKPIAFVDYEPLTEVIDPEKALDCDVDRKDHREGEIARRGAPPVDAEGDRVQGWEVLRDRGDPECARMGSDRERGLRREKVNPLLVEGQVQGGIAQSIGAALMEKTVYDENGQLLAGEFMDYAIPRATGLRRCLPLTPSSRFQARAEAGDDAALWKTGTPDSEPDDQDPKAPF
jgi:hypothetical protein